MKLAKSLQAIKPSYIREILSAANSPDVISLAGGLPDQATFPLDLMAQSLSNLSTMPQLFQYGNTAGYAPLLDYFRVLYQLPSSHDGIICTGSQQALDLIARAFINPGDTVVMAGDTGVIAGDSSVVASVTGAVTTEWLPSYQSWTCPLVSARRSLYYVHKTASWMPLTKWC